MNPLEKAIVTKDTEDLLDYLSATPIEYILNDISSLITPKQCPECEQNKADGMNFCAYCGRQLWDKE